jgi:hypothetical protein
MGKGLMNLSAEFNATTGLMVAKGDGLNVSQTLG